jgi:hypothetical protein
MTLSDLAAFSTALSGAAVTGSLIYLAIQTRQSVRHTRALIQQGSSARTVSIVLSNMEPDVMAAWLEGNGQEATPAAIRKAQFFLLCQTSVTAMEDIFAQHSAGLMQPEVFARNCAVHRNLLLEPGYREYWNNYRVEFQRIAPKFTAFVDGLCVDEATAFGFRL